MSDKTRFTPADENTRAMMAAAEHALRNDGTPRTHGELTECAPRSRDFDPRKPFSIEGVTYRLEDGADISTLYRDAYFADEDPRGVTVEHFAQSWHPMAVYIAAYRSRVRIAEIMRASE